MADEGAEPGENSIEVAGLVKTYGEIRAVDDISFAVRRGEIFAFLGPNGAGKSTTIKVLTTLLRPTSGKIRVNGFDPVTQPDSARLSFGIVFQDPSVDDELTGWENLEFHGILYGLPKKLRRQRIDDLLHFVDLHDRRASQVKEYSGGMKRRLEIARGLLHLPKIIFLDEPTLGLDPQTRNPMWAYLRQLNETEGTTVFFTTHYMEEADRVAQRDRHHRPWQDRRLRHVGGVCAAQTDSASLEDAFLALTGKSIRDEEAGGAFDRMRMCGRGRGHDNGRGCRHLGFHPQPGYTPSSTPPA